MASPETKAAKIARIMDKDPSYARKTMREVRAAMDDVADAHPVGATPPTLSDPGTHQPAPPVSVAVRAVPQPTQPVQGSGRVNTDDLTDADPFATSTPVLAGR